MISVKRDKLLAYKRAIVRALRLATSDRASIVDVVHSLEVSL